MASYWDTVLSRRIGRRRALAATGATAAGAALLAACGGGDDDSGGGGTKDASGLLATYQDTLKDAKTGGTLTINNQGDPLHFDGQAQGQIQLNVFQSLAHSALVQNRPGKGVGSSYTDVDPYLASSWEISPDKLTITFKLRDGVKWHNVAPVNGRTFEAADVVASYDRYTGASTPNNKGTNFNKINPNAPILSYTAPDSKTLVLKLNAPSSFLFQRLAGMVTGEMGAIYPKEALEGKYDPKTTQIGTGGYMLDKFTPSVEIVMKRNPEYFDKINGPFYDRVVYPVLPEYATQLAQFKTGAVTALQPGVRPEDILATKADVPALNMYANTVSSNQALEAMRFGWLPIGGKPSPFLDIRLRQALAMCLDREAYIDVLSNVSKFEAAGLAVKSYYFTSIPYVAGYTLDPRDTKTFGENAKYYQFNLPEAKKLFEAAKSTYGGDYPEIQAARVVNFFSAAFTQSVDIMDQFMRDLGLKIAAKPIIYNTEYLPNYVTKAGQFEGLLWGLGAVTSSDTTDYWVWRAHSKTFQQASPTSGAIGFGGPDGSKGDKSGDPQVDALIDKAVAEYDSKKRIEIGGDLQRYLAKQNYYVLRPGLADNFLLAWPSIQNFNYFQGDSKSVQPGAVEAMYNIWSDPTKPGHKA